MLGIFFTLVFLYFIPLLFLPPLYGWLFKKAREEHNEDIVSEESIRYMEEHLPSFKFLPLYNAMLFYIGLFLATIYLIR